MTLDPATLSALMPMFKGRMNNLEGIGNCDFHFFGFSAADLSGIPNTPLGLPGIWGGYGLRDLMDHFCSERVGWFGARQHGDTQKFELPVHKGKPKHVAPTPRMTEASNGRTHSTVKQNGHESYRQREHFASVLRSQAAHTFASPGRSAEECARLRAEQCWPNGEAYGTSFGPGDIGPRSVLGRLESDKAWHRSEAMVRTLH